MVCTLFVASAEYFVNGDGSVLAYMFAAALESLLLLFLYQKHTLRTGRIRRIGRYEVLIGCIIIAVATPPFIDAYAESREGPSADSNGDDAALFGLSILAALPVIGAGIAHHRRDRSTLFERLYQWTSKT
jgi:hypothetical protein